MNGGAAGGRGAAAREAEGAEEKIMKCMPTVPRTYKWSRIQVMTEVDAA